MDGEKKWGSTNSDSHCLVINVLFNDDYNILRVSIGSADNLCTLMKKWVIGREILAKDLGLRYIQCLYLW